MNGRLLPAAVGALALLGAAGVAVSAAEGGLDAEVTGKAHDENGAYVVVTTDLGGLEFARYLPTEAWSVVQPGDEVVYHVHSGETSIYTWESGSLIWRG